MKLSHNQREFLDTLTTGPTCAPAYRPGFGGAVSGLVRRGFIRKVGLVGACNKYEITDAGREAAMQAAWERDEKYSWDEAVAEHDAAVRRAGIV